MIKPITLVGYGQSRSGQVNDPVKFMINLLSSLDFTAPVIISPSMSGSVSLPFLTAHPDKVKGYIPVAPVSTGRYTSQYPSIKVSMLLQLDKVVLCTFSGSHHSNTFFNPQLWDS